MDSVAPQAVLQNSCWLVVLKDETYKNQCCYHGI